MSIFEVSLKNLSLLWFIISLMKKRGEESLKSQVYRSMYQAILEGKYPPGSVFTEKELVEKYEMSKSPIREALIELINEGFLKSIPRYGYEVLNVSEDEIEAVKETRLILEIGALEKCFDRISKDNIEKLYSLLESKNAEPTLLEHWQRNTDFHIALSECYENEFLTNKLKECFSVMARAYMQYQYKRHNNKTSFKSEGVNHRALIKAIEEGDKAKAITLLTLDINDFEAKS